MSPSDSPPARHTCAAIKSCRIPAREQQSTPPQEETSNTVQDSGTAQITRVITPEESPLSSITEGPSKGTSPSEGASPPSNDANSDHGTICKNLEEVDASQNDPEQSYTTAPGSLGLSTSVKLTSPSKACMDKGKGHMHITPAQEATSSLHWSERELSPRITMSGESWARLKNDLQN
jgi:hypothetical protein